MNLVSWAIKRLYVNSNNISKELWDGIHANWDNDPNFKHIPYPDTFHHDWLTNSKSKIVRPICNWFLTKKYPYYLPMVRVEFEPIPAKEVKCVWTKETEAALASTFSLKVEDLLTDFVDDPRS